MKKRIFLSLCIFFIILSIILSPQTYIKVCSSAIEVWAKILLPSLLPFFIFTKLLTSIGYVQTISANFKNLSFKLYKSPPISAYIFLMSILTGYPVGSKLTSDLFNSGAISKNDAQKCTSFTSNSGPMFIVGSVGIGMLFSATCDYIILISHIIGALINGLIYRNLKGENKKAVDYAS